MHEIGRPHVLLAEDDDTFRDLMAQRLARLGFFATMAANQHQAKRVIGSGLPIDLLITDNTFTNGRQDADDGLEIIDYLAENDIQIPIITFGNDTFHHMKAERDSITHDLVKGSFSELEHILAGIKSSWDLREA